MTQHKALVLVDQCAKRAREEASRRNSAYDRYGMDNTPESCDTLGMAMAAELRTQHALIVQMWRALRDMVEASQGKFGDLVFMVKASQDAAEAIAAADKYLG